MKTLISIVLILLLSSPALAKQSREEKQAELDAVCEAARQKKLTPMRAGFVEECGGRAPLFYDLPACVTAFEFAQSSRNRD
jgi:hypothetical protein